MSTQFTYPTKSKSSSKSSPKSSPKMNKVAPSSTILEEKIQPKSHSNNNNNINSMILDESDLSHQDFRSELKTEKKHFNKKINLPKIFQTTLLDELAISIRKNKITVLRAPTGFGKTVVVNHVMSKYIIECQKTGQTVPICISSMPYRITVKEMYHYLKKIFPENSFGYLMRGDSCIPDSDHCKLVTSGCCFELIVNMYIERELKTPSIFFIDEAHDASWQTDLVLHILVWLQKKGYPIKIIISSATLDIENQLNGLDVKHISLPDEKANIDVAYFDGSFREFDDNMKTQILNIIKNFMLETAKKISNILIIMPGQNEITTMCEYLTENIKDIDVAELHSQLEKEDMEKAIEPSKNGIRKIIVSTNIVENAITIDGLGCIIDCGLRKINCIDKDGIQQLKLEKAAKSNIIQAFGRVGRQGIRGKAYVMMSEKEFEKLPNFAINEVYRNPLYNQIIRLASDKMVCNVHDIMSHISQDKIDEDINKLIEVDACIKIDQKLITTSYGKFMVQVSMSLTASKFLFYAMSNMDKKYQYFYIVTACWIDSNSSFFYTNKKQSLTDAKKSPLCKEDCFTTMINIWNKSLAFYDEKEGRPNYKQFNKWCKENSLFSKTLINIEKNVYHTMQKLAEIYPKSSIKIQPIDPLNEEIVIASFKKGLYEIFENNILRRNYYGKYLGGNASIDFKLNILGSPEKILSFGKFRVGSGAIILSKIVLPLKDKSTNDYFEIGFGIYL